MKKAYTREELYELVWSTPISRLAAEFGMTDRGIGKMCQRHDIPTPPRGYWAKLSAGQVVKRTPLPVTKEGLPRAKQKTPPKRARVATKSLSSMRSKLRKPMAKRNRRHWRVVRGLSTLKTTELHHHSTRQNAIDLQASLPRLSM